MKLFYEFLFFFKRFAKLSITLEVKENILFTFPFVFLQISNYFFFINNAKQTQNWEYFQYLIITFSASDLLHNAFMRVKAKVWSIGK